MWIIVGLFAITATVLNLFLYFSGKDHKLAMALGLSFTALTMCAAYSLVSQWVKAGDWAALEDVVPGMEKALWVLVIISILLNTAPMILGRGKK
ncbi:hypothetical protein Q0N12_10865 [Rossellomorea marisflavi]|uniref:hypothetical protein n=1 Tax=Rossellomorea marisflavi TaxID=189381 RepID=UPI0034590879